MKKFALLMGLLLLVSVTAKAQDSSKIEAFGGYSYLRFSPGGGASSINFNGGIGSVAYNLTDMFSVVGEFAGYHAGDVEGSHTSVNSLSYLFGPKASKSFGKITPFGQALFGGAHASLSGGEEAGATSNGFSMALGGGLDYGVTRHIGVRLAQVDYLYTRFNSFDNHNQNSFRYSAGVVVNF